MEIGNIIPHIEALIFASDKPLTSMEITELINNAFGFMEEKLTLEQIQTSIEGIIEKYASEFYPFEVRESGGGWQFLTKKDYHKTVAQLNGEKFLKRLSSAALETLAIIAYKQPITKGEIEAIRGVSSDYSIQKLLEKELIVISGRNEDMVGKPLVYTTSKTFMDYFGINSAADLPKLKEVFAETLIEPTLITHSPDEIAPLQPNTARVETADAGETADGDAPLRISEQGELLEGAGGESDEVEDDESSSWADEGEHPESAVAANIPPYADEDDLAPEFPEAKTADTDESDEQADEAGSDGESDEEGDDTASGFPHNSDADNHDSDDDNPAPGTHP